MTVQVGTVIRNNDPREEGAVATIVSLSGNRAWYEKNGRRYGIKLSRIKSDGKSRHQGWNVVPRAPVEDTRFDVV